MYIYILIIINLYISICFILCFFHTRHVSVEGPWPTFCGTGKRWPRSTGPSLEMGFDGEKPWIFATENDLKWWTVIVWWCLIHIVLWCFMIFYELMPKFGSNPIARNLASTNDTRSFSSDHGLPGGAPL